MTYASAARGLYTPAIEPAVQVRQKKLKLARHGLCERSSSPGPSAAGPFRRVLLAATVTNLFKSFWPKLGLKLSSNSS
jgi:hypothetical protein